MRRRLLNTGRSFSPLFLRLALGAVMIAHGLQQTFGLLGGAGLPDKLAYYNSLGVPTWVGFIGVMIISIGAILLVLGYWTRVMAFFIGLFLLSALFMGHHIDHGFFMNWENNQAGEGFEFHILGLGICIALMIYGAGRLSIDRFIITRRRKIF